MSEDIKLIPRNGITIFRDEHSLTFLPPLSDYDGYLFVIYEDPYGDSVSGMMNKEMIMNFHQLDSETIDNIYFKFGLKP